MSKSVTLSETVREDIARKLTTKAVQKQSDQLHNQLRKLNDDYWEAYRKRVEKELSPLGPKDWKRLAGHGMLNRTSSAYPIIPYEDEKGRDGWTYPLKYSLSEPVKRILGDTGVLQSRRENGGVRFLEQRRHGSSFVITFVAPEQLPYMRDMDKVRTKRFLDRVDRAANRSASLFSATLYFYKDTMRILQSCRTSRQLEDVFPEAAKLVPAPQKRENEMVPQEEINRVRQTLEAGVSA